MTTHSPLVVAASNPNELFLIERRGGITSVVSAVTREPYLSDVIKKEVLDLGEYWLSGSLGGIPEAPYLDDEDEAGEKNAGDESGDSDSGEQPS
jgi:hypothetical protein